jgi:5-methylthioribose kinase
VDAQDHTQDQDANYTNSKNYKDNREEYANKAGKTTTDLLKFQFDNNDIGALATTNSHTGNYVNTNSNNRVINPIIAIFCSLSYSFLSSGLLYSNLS